MELWDVSDINGKCLLIREARTDDYKDIYLLNKEGLGYEYPVEKTRGKLQIILSSTHDRIFVAEFHGNVVGYIHLSAYECTYAVSLKNILAIVVAPAYRGKGIGKVLLTKGEEWAKKENACGIRLVSGFNRVDAHQFYAACGYTLRKEQKNFIKLFE